MTKADIVERIHQRIGFSKKESAEMVETVFGLLKLTLESGEKIKIAGFGNFVVKQKADRRGAAMTIDQLCWRARVQDATGAHRYDSVTQRLGLVQLMRDEKHAHTVATKPVHRRPHAPPRRWVQSLRE